MTEAEASAARAELLRKVALGQITPPAAEAEASAAGLPAFQVFPEDTRLDPLKESHWTLLMAVAWIMSRNPDAVCQVECRPLG
jgi:hypothetical protein